MVNKIFQLLSVNQLISIILFTCILLMIILGWSKYVETFFLLIIIIIVIKQTTYVVL